MGLFDFSNTFDNTISTVTTAASKAGSSILGGIANSVTNFPSMIGDIATSTAARVANSTISEARSLVSQRMFGLLNSVVPRSSNSILNSIGSQVVGAAQNQAGVILNGGVDQILSTIGVSANTPVRSVYPVVYNNGVAAANTIITEVNNGNRDVSGIISSTQDPLAELLYRDQTYRANQEIMASTGASPYAMDLFKYAPKYAFLFVCEFTFETGFEALGLGESGRNKFAMIIQNFDQPRVTYEHEEYNYYNFRTKVAKRVTHENLKLQFLDDRENSSMNFITNYLIMTHPIMGISPTSSSFYEEAGMSWTISDTEGGGIAYNSVNSASFRAMPNDVINAIKEIKVYHIYDYGNRMNVYHFIRPKVVAVELDRWDMRGATDVATIGCEFAYDGLYVELGLTITKGEGDKLGNLSRVGLYPMQPHSSDGAAVQTVPMTPSEQTTTSENQVRLDNLINNLTGLDNADAQVSVTPVTLSNVQGTPLA